MKENDGFVKKNMIWFQQHLYQKSDHTYEYMKSEFKDATVMHMPKWNTTFLYPKSNEFPLFIIHPFVKILFPLVAHSHSKSFSEYNTNFSLEFISSNFVVNCLNETSPISYKILVSTYVAILQV